MNFRYLCTMNRRILGIAIPAIIANITVPLLGLIDLSIAGHLGSAECMGAIAVGSMMFSLVYQNFGFLRMGTSGITAQAYGSKDMRAAAVTLLRAALLALAIGIAILLMQYPLQWLVLLAIGPSPEVLHLAQSYFFICVWGAPAILLMMSIKGWLLGMQDSRSPMVISISVNVANVIASITAVYILKMGFIGIAFGTLVSEYIGLGIALFIIVRRHRGILRNASLAETLKRGTLGRFFSVNRDIFLRSVCLMTVTLSFTAIGARSGDLILATNAMMMQMFLLISYFMDGFAFAGEALVGRYCGAQDYSTLHRCIRYLFGWGCVVMAVFAIAYGFFAPQIFGILTDDADVIATATIYRLWCIAIPIASMAGFVWDGVFIGLTATRGMLVSIAVACVSFYTLNIFPLYCGTHSNDWLWLAFVVYLAMRGIVQTIYYITRLRNDTSS